MFRSICHYNTHVPCQLGVFQHPAEYANDYSSKNTVPQWSCDPLFPFSVVKSDLSYYPSSSLAFLKPSVKILTPWTPACVACVPSRLRLHASFFRPSTRREGTSKTSWLRAWLLNMASRRRLCGTFGACVRGRKRQDRSGRMRKGNDFLARSYAPTAPVLVFRQFKWHALHAARSYHARRRRRSVL